jgi:putative membrane protein
MRGSIIAALLSAIVIMFAQRQVIVAVHVMAVIAWMAGLFYLPRLFVYHCKATAGAELDETLKVMERKLYWFIMQPAGIISVILGFYLSGPLFAHIVHGGNGGGWVVLKSLLGLGMTGFHIALGFALVRFASGTNNVTERGWRFLNEFPTLLMIPMVFLAVVKPF